MSILEGLMKLLDGPRDGALLRFGIAKELHDQQRSAEAIVHLEKALALQPEYSAAWKLLGHVLKALGRDDDALAAWRQGIEVATARGDIQAVKEMTVFARRIEKARSGGNTP